MLTAILVAAPTVASAFSGRTAKRAGNGGRSARSMVIGCAPFRASSFQPLRRSPPKRSSGVIACQLTRFAGEVRVAVAIKTRSSLTPPDTERSPPAGIGRGVLGCQPPSRCRRGGTHIASPRHRVSRCSFNGSSFRNAAHVRGGGGRLEVRLEPEDAGRDHHVSHENHSVLSSGMLLPARNRCGPDQPSLVRAVILPSAKMVSPRRIVRRTRP